MRTRLKIDFGLTLLITVLVWPFSAKAIQDLPDPEVENQTTVEIEYPPEYLLPFRDRRPDWSPLFSVKYETFTPKKYVSPDPEDPASYSGLFGSKSAQMFGPQAGVKKNFDWGAVVTELSWQTGSVNASSNNADVTLEMTKTAAHFGLWLDTIWPDPYLVPYIQGDYMNIDFKETSVLSEGTARQSGTAQGVFGYTGGVMLLLNWLDRDASFNNLEAVGINNTYLDFFVTKTIGSGARDFSNDWDWGAGLTMEF